MVNCNTPKSTTYCGLLIAALLMVLFTACTTTSQPKHPADACKIYTENSSWYKHTRKAEKKWNVDGAVLLAIMHQESAFDAKAKPKRKRFLGIPLRRPSSAYGYAQALDGTWADYKKKTNRLFAQRNKFSHAIDFIGWYVAQSRRQLRISPTDAYRNYLAYHEGWGGYRRATYKQKKWLIAVAKKVSRQAAQYRRQLKRCSHKLD